MKKKSNDILKRKRNVSYFGILTFAIALMCIELIIRNIYNVPFPPQVYSPFLYSLIVAIIIVFSESLILSILYVTFTTICYMIQFSNLAYFGYWISPMDIWLIYKNISEVSLEVRTVFKHHLISAILIGCAVLFTITLLHCRKYITHKSKFITILGIMLLALYPIKGFLKGNSYTLGQNSKINLPVLKSSLYTFGFFISRIVPEEIFERSRVKAYTPPPITINTSPLTDNIIIIMGESLSAEYMSAFGFQENTTPWLNTQKNLSNHLLIKGFSGGLFTDVSLPYFFNMVEKPNARQLIVQESQNLFRMAKEQGFKTVFYTTQMHTGLELVSLLGKKWIDDYQDSYQVTHNTLEALDDSYLVNWLKNIPLSNKNFIVLQQNGSHGPYVNRSPAQEKLFGQDSLYSEYLNSVHYTDKILSQLQDVIQTLPGSWTLVFTSDHGEHVTHQSSGKGSFDFPSNYSVPVYVATNKNSLAELAQKRLANCPYAFQVQVSQFIGELLGYQKTFQTCTSGFIAGKDITGSSGYIKIIQQDNQYTKEFLQ